MLVRLQKFLAEAGLGSRRKCEEIILEKRVQVNGQSIQTLGVKIDPHKDEVRVDGKLVKPEQKVYLILHKPKGYLCTTEDPQQRRTVYHLLPPLNQRVFPIGRLDKDSSGLILFTNDGEFANRLAHPRYGIRRTYFVIIKGNLEQKHFQKITQKGVWLAEGKTQPAKIKILKKSPDTTHLEITICEGKNREVRRIFARFGYKVKKLVRISFGPFKLDGLKEGKYRFLPNHLIEKVKCQQF